MHKPHRKPKPEGDRVLRINISMPPDLHAAALKLVKPLLYSDFSDLVSGLLRREIARKDRADDQDLDGGGSLT